MARSFILLVILISATTSWADDDFKVDVKGLASLSPQQRKAIESALGAKIENLTEARIVNAPNPEMRSFDEIKKTQSVVVQPKDDLTTPSPANETSKENETTLASHSTNIEMNWQNLNETKRHLKDLQHTTDLYLSPNGHTRVWVDPKTHHILINQSTK
jgi:hypothetical protein